MDLFWRFSNAFWNENVSIKFVKMKKKSSIGSQMNSSRKYSILQTGMLISLFIHHKRSKKLVINPTFFLSKI